MHRTSTPTPHELIQKVLVGDAVGSAPFSVLVADERMRFAAASEGACRLLGWSLEELLRLTVEDVVVEQEPARRLYDEFVASGSQRGRITLRRKDGATIDAVYEAYETRMSELPYYVSVIIPL